MKRLYILFDQMSKMIDDGIINYGNFIVFTLFLLLLWIFAQT